MALKSDIENKVKEIIDTAFSVENVSIVPDIDDSRLTFGNKGLRFEATALFIDMRGSTEILNKHNRTTVSKLHMAYFHTIVRIAKNRYGEVRSFNGDGMLVFFEGTSKQSLNNAVRAAMEMTYMLTQSKVKDSLSKYSEINFGIGLDDGHILCTKVGIAGTNNRDLIWIGNAVNKSVKIGDKLYSPYHIGISSYVYSNLSDENKYHTTKDSWGNENTVNMWKQGTFEYNGNNETYYFTNYYWGI
ncbi:MAG: adenylate/guanylate cyclase domain-containing protein [Candidatus Thiodiazotropha sp.]